MDDLGIRNGMRDYTLTEREAIDRLEGDFSLHFTDDANELTCRRCGLLFTFGRLDSTRSILAALQAHLRNTHHFREHLRSWEEV